MFAIHRNVYKGVIRNIIKMNKIVEFNFVLEESGLWRCKECGGTYEDENECLRHLGVKE